MKLPLRYKILLYIILPLVFLSYLPTLCLPYLKGLNRNSTLLYNELSRYALENSGLLPKSGDAALEQTGITAKILEQFGFVYGVNINKVERKDGKLYDEADERIFLIYPKGFKFWLNRRCENLSLQLHETVGRN